MIQTPTWGKPHICVDYPKSNKLIFEEWLYQQELPETEREYLPIFWTSYWVNNGYGNDAAAKQKMQDYVNSLDTTKKYWTVWQYDDGMVVDMSHLDILTFGMSYRDDKDKPDVNLPLIGQPYVLSIATQKKYKACFVGSITDPIRKQLVESLAGKEGYYISTAPHDELQYHQILAESTFALAPRGYGLPSFRAYEAMQHGTIPVYISDKFMYPYGMWDEFGVDIAAEDVHYADMILGSYSQGEIDDKRSWLKENFDKYFTYTGCRQQIINYLLSE